MVLKKILFTMMLSALLVACATNKPIYNSSQVAFMQELTETQAQDVIKDALRYKRWKVVSDDNPGEIVADIVVRSHYAKVRITYDMSQFSINYMKSDDLDFDAGKNKIHRNYNKWILLLEQEIVQRSRIVR